MAFNDSINNAPASLFDRLIDREPLEASEPRPLRVVSRREFEGSVIAELSRLFNTRSDPRRNDPRGLTVLDYGLPDFSSFFPASQENQRRLTEEIARAITIFEPRLRRARACVTGVKSQGGLLVRIDATLVVGTVQEPVSFPVVISNRDSVVEVHAGE